MGSQLTKSTTNETSSSGIRSSVDAASATSRLRTAVKRGDLDALLTLLDVGCDPDIGSSSCTVDDEDRSHSTEATIDWNSVGEFALTTAVRLGHYHLVPALLTSGWSSRKTGSDADVAATAAATRPAVRILLRRILVSSASNKSYDQNDDDFDGDDDNDDDDDDDDDDDGNTITTGIVELERHRRNVHRGAGGFDIDDDDRGADVTTAVRHCDLILRQHSDGTEVVRRLAVTSSSSSRRYGGGGGGGGRSVDCLRYIVRRLVDSDEPTPPSKLVLVDDSALNCDGDTAVILAVRRRRYDLVADLLAAGCDVDRRNARRRTALDELIEALFPVTQPPTHDVNNNSARYGRRRRHYLTRLRDYLIDVDECPVRQLRQLRQEPVGGVVDDWSTDRLPAAVLTLLEAGAARSSLSLGWFVLHCVHDVYAVRQLVLNCFDDNEDDGDVERRNNRRRVVADKQHRSQLFRLLLQTAAKFNQLDNAEMLLRRVNCSSASFWMSDSTAAEARSLLPGDSPVTWTTVERLADDRRLGLLADRVLDALPLPVSAAILLLRAANGPDAARRIVAELVRSARVDDCFETGRAIEMFYPYAGLRPPPKHGGGVDDVRRRLLRTIVAYGPPRLPAKTVQQLASRYDIDADEYWRLIRADRTRPRRLKDLCRRCVRFNLRSNVYYGVDRLTLPPAVRDYVVRLADDDDGDC